MTATYTAAIFTLLHDGTCAPNENFSAENHNTISVLTSADQILTHFVTMTWLEAKSQQNTLS